MYKKDEDGDKRQFLVVCGFIVPIGGALSKRSGPRYIKVAAGVCGCRLAGQMLGMRSGAMQLKLP